MCSCFVVITYTGEYACTNIFAVIYGQRVYDAFAEISTAFLKAPNNAVN